jgi:predicted secreted hydrolase
MRRGEAGEFGGAIAKDGSVRTSRNAVVEPQSYWRSLYTGIRYPVDWRLSLPDYGMDLRVAVMLNRQEMPIAGPIRAIWEGACQVSGELRATRAPVRGKGFVELVGYAGDAGG